MIHHTQHPHVISYYSTPLLDKMKETAKTSVMGNRSLPIYYTPMSSQGVYSSLGLIMTNLFKHSGNLMGLLKLFSFFMWKNVPQGAATTCYVALHPQLKDATGKYFLDCNEYQPSKLANDEDLAKKLWDFSNKLIDSALSKNAAERPATII
ncbi:hypothetical protein Leryth_011086 [Lithospermum erythrorhizon]|nr:hypothetical protein Leryth_011086 [Lithospermum erythrorhizon]